MKLSKHGALNAGLLLIFCSQILLTVLFEPPAKTPEDIRANNHHAHWPIILDLNKDAAPALSKRSYEWHFDFDHNSFAEETQWLTAEDGFLVWDHDSNGLIDNGHDFPGVKHFYPEENGSLDRDLLEIFDFDSDSNGVIDERDDLWTELAVWIDQNNNTYTDDGELSTLDSLSIRSLRIVPLAELKKLRDTPNNIYTVATIEFTDGSTASAMMTKMDVDRSESQMLRMLPMSDEIAELPNLNGKGNAATLVQEMLLDHQLTEAVKKFVSERNPDTRMSLSEEIFLRWTNTDPLQAIAPAIEDVWKVKALVSMYGDTFYRGDLIGNNELSMLSANYHHFLNKLHGDLMKRSHLVDTFDLIDYELDTSTYVYRGDLSKVIVTIDQLLAVNRPVGLKLLSEFTQAFRDTDMEKQHNYDDFRNHYLFRDNEIAFTFAAAGLISKRGTADSDYFYELAGEFSFSGGPGDDTYHKYQRGGLAILAGDGNNSIIIQHDQRYLSGWRLENSIFTGDGDNRIELDDAINFVRTGDGDDSLTIRGGLSQIDLGDGNNIVVDAALIESANRSLGNTHTLALGSGSDSVTLTQGGIYTIDTGANNDSIELGNGNFTLSPALGNDEISISSGTTDIRLSLGDGNDTLTVSGENPRVYLSFYGDIGIADIRIQSEAEQIVLRYGSAGDTITLLGFHNFISANSNEMRILNDAELRFADGEISRLSELINP